MPATTPAEQPAIRPGLRVVALDRTKAERIEREHRPRPHREDVPDDPAHSGRSSLERLNGARVIVALHLERHRPAIADIDHARILLARLDEDSRPGCWKFAQLLAGILVGTMLAPHHREDAQLREVRRPPEDRDDALVLLRREPMFRNQLRSNGRVRHRCGKVSDARSGSPRNSRCSGWANPRGPPERSRGEFRSFWDGYAEWVSVPEAGVPRGEGRLGRVSVTLGRICGFSQSNCLLPQLTPTFSGSSGPSVRSALDSFLDDSEFRNSSRSSSRLHRALLRVRRASQEFRSVWEGYAAFLNRTALLP